MKKNEAEMQNLRFIKKNNNKYGTLTRRNSCSNEIREATRHLSFYDQA